MFGKDSYQSSPTQLLAKQVFLKLIIQTVRSVSILPIVPYCDKSNSEKFRRWIMIIIQYFSYTITKQKLPPIHWINMTYHLQGISTFSFISRDTDLWTLKFRCMHHHRKYLSYGNFLAWVNLRKDIFVSERHTWL